MKCEIHDFKPGRKKGVACSAAAVAYVMGRHMCARHRGTRGSSHCSHSLSAGLDYCTLCGAKQEQR